MVLMLEVLLKAILEPVGDVFAVKGDIMLCHFGLDSVVGCAVIKHLIDDVALVFGKLGDFAGGFGVGLKMEGATSAIG
jgi:hypothetical protein